MLYIKLCQKMSDFIKFCHCQILTEILQIYSEYEAANLRLKSLRATNVKEPRARPNDFPETLKLPFFKFIVTLNIVLITFLLVHIIIFIINLLQALLLVNLLPQTKTQFA